MPHFAGVNAFSGKCITSKTSETSVQNMPVFTASWCKWDFSWKALVQHILRDIFNWKQLQRRNPKFWLMVNNLFYTDINAARFWCFEQSVGRKTANKKSLSKKTFRKKKTFHTFQEFKKSFIVVQGCSLTLLAIGKDSWECYNSPIK